MRLQILCIGTLIVSGIAHGGQGTKDYWSWKEQLAYTGFPSGIVIGIWFDASYGCDKTKLTIIGNNQIKKIGLVIDDNSWDMVDTQRGKNASDVYLSRSALRKLKIGINAAVLTDRGRIGLSLKGSAKSINEAWKHCEQIKSSHLKRLEPEILSSGDSSADIQGKSDIQFIDTKGGKIFGLGDVVFFSGEIERGDLAHITYISEQMRFSGRKLSSVVFVKSPGGNVYEAMIIGRYLRENRVNTAVYEMCASACIYAFSGGNIRTSYRNSLFGLHQTYYADGSKGSLREGQKIVASRYRYLEDMGINPKIAVWESEVEPEKIRWISQYEAKGLLLVSRIIENHMAPKPPIKQIRE